MRVVDSLRAQHKNVTFEHRHSGLTLSLRGDVVESEYMLMAKSARMVALSALASHPAFDAEKNQEQSKTAYFEALSCIPYMTGGKSGVEVVTDDRMKSIQEYNEMRRKAIKDVTK